MAYELYVAGDPPARFHTEQEAVEAVASALGKHPDAHVELIDLATGHPALLGTSPNWRHHLRNRHLKHHSGL